MAINWGSIFGGAATGAAAGPWGALAGGVLGAVAGGTGTTVAGGKGALVGGTVVSSGGGRLQVRTTKGTVVTIKRAKHRRYHGRSRGNSMAGMMRQAMQYKLLAQAMK